MTEAAGLSAGAARRPSTVIRPFASGDAQSLCDLYNRTSFGIARFGHPHRAEDLLRGFDESAVVSVLVAVDGDDQVMGTVWCMPVVAQDSARKGGLFVENFVVDPRLRLGRLAAELLTAAATHCLDLGFGRVDLKVLAKNRGAIGLYRKAGFRLIGAEPCDDDTVTMEAYPSALADFLAGWADRGVHEQSYRRNPLSLLIPPASHRGPLLSDVVMWHGRPVVAYDLRTGDGEIASVLIDRSTGCVCAVEGGGLSVAAYASEETPGLVHVEVASSMPEAERGTLSVSGGRRAESVDSITIAPGEVQRHHFGVDASPRAAGVVASFVASEAHSRRPPFEVHSLASLDADPSEARRPVGSMVPLDASLAIARGDCSVAIDAGSGELQVSHRGRVLCQELWPEAGPPYPGGYKRPRSRPVVIVAPGPGELVLSSCGNPWAAQTSSVQSSRVVGPRSFTVYRRIRLLDAGVILLQTAVLRTGSLPPGAQPWLRTFARTTLRSPRIHVALDTGRVDEPVDPRSFPFTLADTEHVLVSGLPADPSRFTEPWSAFTSDGQVTGLFWPGAEQVRFGGSWMPSVCYRIAPMSLGSVAVLPPMLLVVGDGAADRVAQEVHDHARELAWEIDPSTDRWWELDEWSDR